MTYTFEFVRRAARNRALWLIALGSSLYACNATDQLTGNSETPTDPSSATPAEPEFSTTFAGGISMGTWNQPTSVWGSRFNGGLRTIGTNALLSELKAIKAKGGKIVLSFVGNQRNFKTNGHFDMNKWKNLVARYKNINFGSYITDGTVIGQVMLDEPNDPHNWGGRPVTNSQLEEMGKFSKSIWPNLATLVRTEPSYLGGGHRYVDGAWAQYVARKGNVGDYIKKRVSDAQRYGLSLVVGLNIRKGGPGGRQMTPSQVSSWGSALLNTSYPCAFLSWEYASFVTSSSYANAFGILKNKAQSRATKSCRS
jgi:hypothetical protein